MMRRATKQIPTYIDSRHASVHPKQRNTSRGGFIALRAPCQL